MNELTKRLIEMTEQARRIQTNSELALKQFQVAADKNDKDKMEEARIAGHEFLDQLFDIFQELSEIRTRQMDQVFKDLGKG